jgi:hypothetical protein
MISAREDGLKLVAWLNVAIGPRFTILKITLGNILALECRYRSRGDSMA